MSLKPLTVYRAETLNELARRKQQNAEDLTGVECPTCHEETFWDGGVSLICTDPPMRRMSCKCGFSEVVPYMEP